MTPPRVQCTGCDRAWHSVTLADGLRLIGSCPRCGGELVFLGAPGVATVDAVDPFSNTLLPHLVLGRPKR